MAREPAHVLSEDDSMIDGIFHSNALEVIRGGMHLDLAFCHSQRLFKIV